LVDKSESSGLKPPPNEDARLSGVCRRLDRPRLGVVHGVGRRGPRSTSQNRIDEGGVPSAAVGSTADHAVAMRERRPSPNTYRHAAFSFTPVPSCAKTTSLPEALADLKVD